MSIIQGIQGTGSIVSEGRPKNWREKILYLFPNGAPLTALLSKTKKEATDDPEFNWWSKELLNQRALINDGNISSNDSVAGAVTTIKVDDGSGASGEAKKFVQGSVVLNERTNEIMVVTIDPAVDTEITVDRGRGGTSATTLNDDDGLIVIGSAYEEGAMSPTSRYKQPTKDSNFTQIFRESLSATRTARKTRLRYDKQGISPDAMRDALQLHAIEMEKAFIFGGKEEITGPNGQPERLTAGVKSYISTNVKNFAGTVTETLWDTEMEKLFRFGSQTKVAFAGSQALLTMSRLAKDKGVINLVPADQTYGIRFNEYVTPFGTLMMVIHPLFTGHPVWGLAMLVVDFDHLVFRYIDDTVFLPHRQERGRDARVDEFLTEAGLEVHHEKTHAWYTNMTAYSSS